MSDDEQHIAQTCRVVKLTWIQFSDSAQQPKRGTPDSAGYDLYADNEHPILLEAGETNLIPTNVGCILPKGTYGRIAPRSGLAYRNGIDILGGVIDADYRQPIGVLLHNTSQNTPCFVVKKGDRIAQLIIERCYQADAASEQFLSENQAQKLPEYKSQRDGGFGSTGK